MASYARRQLVDFLIGKAFDPVLNAKTYGRSDDDKRALVDVQEATRAEIDRFRAYPSAEAVVQNFRRDLTAASARKIHADLRRLKLPVLEDFKEEFEHKARTLGVDA
jgi:hypothetical protein